MTNKEARQVLQEVWRDERTDYQSVEFREALDRAIKELGKEEYQMADKIRKAIKEEFKYMASQGRTQYSMEEVIYIVNEVIDEVEFEENSKV